MKRPFLFFSVPALIAYVSAIIFFGCSKGYREYSYEGGNNNGSFTLIGSPGNCENPIISGYYYADVALTASNTVQLTVDVAKAGPYSIQTNTIDGIYFSASGTFADTGIQVITLQGNGKPDSAGSFVMKVPGTNGCSFTLAVLPYPPGEFTLDGAPNACLNFDAKGLYVAGQTPTVTNTVTVNVNVTKIGSYDLTTDTVDGISFSAKGKFKTIGEQTITLVSSGIPDKPGKIYFTIASTLSSCSFSFIVQNPEPLATYVIESNYGSPNPCVSIISGNYLVNTPLAASEKVSISVYVATVGNFTISTDTLNGMIFYYSGTFTTTGVQYVDLQGSGTPSQQGVFRFSPQIIGPSPLGGASCAFDITAQ